MKPLPSPVDAAILVKEFMPLIADDPLLLYPILRWSALFINDLPPELKYTLSAELAYEGKWRLLSIVATDTSETIYTQTISTNVLERYR